jgi:hypothetical protein
MLAGGRKRLRPILPLTAVAVRSGALEPLPALQGSGRFVGLPAQRFVAKLVWCGIVSTLKILFVATQIGCVVARAAPAYP